MKKRGKNATRKIEANENETLFRLDKIVQSTEVFFKFFFFGLSNFTKYTHDDTTETVCTRPCHSNICTAYENKRITKTKVAESNNKLTRRSFLFDEKSKI